MYQVWEKYMQYQAQNEKVSGIGEKIPGVPLFVVPGSSASNFAFVNTNHKNIYTTINAAFAAMTAGQGDCIVPLPGAHTLSAALAWNVAQTYLIGPELFFGIPCRKSSAIITAAAGAKGITVTAADVVIAGVSVVPVTTKSFLDFSVAAARLRVHQVYVDLATPAANTGTKGFVATGAAPDVHISACVVVSGGAQGPAVDITAMVDGQIEDCLIYNNAGTWAVGIQTGAGVKGMKIRRNRFDCYGTAMTVGIDGTGADQVGGISIDDNYFHSLVGSPLKNFGLNSNKVNLTNNYQGTIGGGTGGALVTVTT